mmetsp:Transcript_103203/g.205085  ORF Transcript_103203/g.205085 Transcript_103203/m.205085 type:complete len:202 (+) Transcript_103203:885-1490(+)
MRSSTGFAPGLTRLQERTQPAELAELKPESTATEGSSCTPTARIVRSSNPCHCRQVSTTLPGFSTVSSRSWVSNAKCASTAVTSCCSPTSCASLSTPLNPVSSARVRTKQPNATATSDSSSWWCAIGRTAELSSQVVSARKCGHLHSTPSTASDCMAVDNPCLLMGGPSKTVPCLSEQSAELGNADRPSTSIPKTHASERN